MFAQQLDRTKPLWEIWLVEGLGRTNGASPPSENGEGELDDPPPRFALLSKTHHALVDGVAGVDITAVLFDTARRPRDAAGVGSTWVPRPEPTSMQLLGDALLERAIQPTEIVRSARSAFRAPRRLVSKGIDSLAAVGALARTGLGAPPTPLNVEIGPHRRFDWVRTDLNEIKEIKNALGGTVNDVVVAVVTGALREFLKQRGEQVDALTMKAMVPVSVRRDEEYGMTGNRVAAMMAPLPVYEGDPVERLRIVSAALGDLKQSGQAVGAEMLTQLSGFAPQTVLAQAGRLQARQRFFNLVITNVPGPQIPLYVLGPRARGRVPPRAARPAPGAVHRDHELQRQAELRPAGRLRRDGRPVPGGPGHPRLDRRAARGGRPRRSGRAAGPPAAGRPSAPARTASNGSTGEPDAPADTELARRHSRPVPAVCGNPLSIWITPVRQILYPRPYRAARRSEPRIRRKCWGIPDPERTRGL